MPIMSEENKQNKTYIEVDKSPWPNWTPNTTTPDYYISAERNDLLSIGVDIKIPMFNIQLVRCPI